MRMKIRLTAALVLALCLVCACAAAQTLPGVEVFSPGLVRVSEKLGRGERVTADAELSVTDMLYVRDVSVLQSMLSGAAFAYEGGGTLTDGMDALRITRGEETLFETAVLRNAQGAELSLNGEHYGLDLSGFTGLLTGGDALLGTAILERVPLTSVCAWIEGLQAGDMLVGGFAVTQTFAVERTMSDDGTRLTKINIEGAIGREGETPWQVSGWLRQPAGRSPKDTAEITLAQDEDNTLTFTYSSTRSSTITRKDEKGEASVETSLIQEGKLGGSRLTQRLTVRLTNAWMADGENLKEKITVSVSLGHTDKAAGRRMQRLNDMSAKLRCVLSLATAESGNDVIDLSEEATLSAIFDGNTFLDVGMKGTASVGGAYEGAQLTGAPVADADTLSAAFKTAAANMARALYAQLGDSAKEKIEKGL